jgi:hypothetical protein
VRDKLYESLNALLLELPRSVWEHHAAALTAYDDALRASGRAQRNVVDAATDPFLAIVEYHPDASEVGNAEMKRAADRFRAAVAAVVSG